MEGLLVLQQSLVLVRAFQYRDKNFAFLQTTVNSVVDAQSVGGKAGICACCTSCQTNRTPRKQAALRALLALRSAGYSSSEMCLRRSVHITARRAPRLQETPYLWPSGALRCKWVWHEWWGSGRRSHKAVKVGACFHLWSPPRAGLGLGGACDSSLRSVADSHVTPDSQKDTAVAWLSRCLRPAFPALCFSLQTFQVMMHFKRQEALLARVIICLWNRISKTFCAVHYLSFLDCIEAPYFSICLEFAFVVEGL